MEYSKRQKGNFKTQLRAELTNCIVITCYNNISYKIYKLDYSMTPLSTFNYNGSDVSF